MLRTVCAYAACLGGLAVFNLLFATPAQANEGPWFNISQSDETVAPGPFGASPTNGASTDSGYAPRYYAGAPVAPRLAIETDLTLETMSSPMIQTAPLGAPPSAYAPIIPRGGRSPSAGAFNVPNTYIDPARAFTHFRMRFDAATDNSTLDRAEYLFAKSGAFRIAGLDADAAGLPLPETDADFFDARGYLELAAGRNISAFVELPVRFLDFDNNEDTSGLGDLNFGVKGVLLTNGEDFVTVQLTTHVPTGDADRGLGTDHLSFEPGVLFHEQSTDRLSFYGEVRYWMPLDGSDFAGDVLRYGVGSAFDLGYGRREREKITAVGEVVAWSILDGAMLNANDPTPPIQSATDTIVNFNVGLRYALNENSFAGTWGHAMTDDVWFEEIFRLEYRRAF